MNSRSHSLAMQDVRPASAPREQILGIRFFNGTVIEAVGRAGNGGLVVAPSGTCFERLLEDNDYRRALTTADVVLADSGLMVTLWRLLRGRHVTRISGLAYLKQLVAGGSFREAGALWFCRTNQRATGS